MLSQSELDKIKQGTKVDINFGLKCPYGIGRICGISNTGCPGIGKGYIIEILNFTGIDKETYPYTHLVVFESNITKVYDEEDKLERFGNIDIGDKFTYKDDEYTKTRSCQSYCDNEYIGYAQKTKTNFGVPFNHYQLVSLLEKRD